MLYLYFFSILLVSNFFILFIVHLHELKNNFIYMINYIEEENKIRNSIRIKILLFIYKIFIKKFLSLFIDGKN